MKSSSNRRPSIQIDPNLLKPNSWRSLTLFQMRSELDLISNPTSPKRRQSPQAHLTRLFNKMRMGSSTIQIHKIKNAEMNLEKINNFTKEELLELAILIFQKPIHCRSIIEIKMLIKCTENIKFFSEMIKDGRTETHEKCCKLMTHKYYKAGETIFNEGSKGYTFYIILTGQVSVNIYEKKTLQVPNMKSSNSVIFEDKNLDFKSETKKKNEHNQLLEMVKVKLLTKGMAFGELALIDNKPRSATIICEEDSHFAILDKQSFSDILKEQEKKKLYDQIEFFVSLKIFQLWSFNAIKKLFLQATQQLYQKNMFVYKENDKSEELFIIKSGEFRILKKVIIDVEKEIHVIDNDLLLFDNYGIQSKKYKILKKFEVGILGPGETFGEEELIFQKNRHYSIICTSSQGFVYILDQKNVQKRIFSNKITKERLLSSINEKNRWRDKRIEEYIQLNIKPQKKSNDYQSLDPKLQMEQVIRSSLSLREKNKKCLDQSNSSYDSKAQDIETSKILFDKTPKNFTIKKHQSALDNLFLQYQKKKKKNVYNDSDTIRQIREKPLALNSPIPNFWEENNKSRTKNSSIKKENSNEKLTFLIESQNKIIDFTKERTNAMTTLTTLNSSTNEKRKLNLENGINHLEKQNNKLLDFFKKTGFKYAPSKERQFQFDSKTDRFTESNTIFKRKSKSYGNIFKNERKLPLKYFSDEIKSKKSINKKNILKN